MFRPLAAAILVLAPATAFAQAQGGTTPERVRSVTLTGDQQCPKGEGNEVVVCSRVDEPYRIPKPFRNDAPIAAKNQSWVNRASVMDEVSRTAGGLPNSCSAIGTGGQTGCFSMYGRAFAAEKREQRRAEESVPGTERYQPPAGDETDPNGE